MKEKTINRAQLRGKPLDPICRKAHVSKGEYGPDDNRCFCYGLYDAMDEEPLEMCRECKAYIDNSEPPKENTGVHKHNNRF